MCEVSFALLPASVGCFRVLETTTSVLCHTKHFIPFLHLFSKCAIGTTLQFDASKNQFNCSLCCVVHNLGSPVWLYRALTVFSVKKVLGSFITEQCRVIKLYMHEFQGVFVLAVSNGFCKRSSELEGKISVLCFQLGKTTKLVMSIDKHLVMIRI